MSKDLLSDSGKNNVLLVLWDMINAALETNDNALGDPKLRSHLEKGFDVVLVSPFIASEAGYHLAHR